MVPSPNYIILGHYFSATRKCSKLSVLVEEQQTNLTATSLLDIGCLPFQPRKNPKDPHACTPLIETSPTIPKEFINIILPLGSAW